MNEKIKAQICFAGTADLKKVEDQLIQLKKEDSFEFYCCFLPRHIVEAKEFNPAIVDLLENTLGDTLTWVFKDYDTFDNVMKDMSIKRKETANLVNRMFVLDSKEAKGVAEEIKLFTECKVILM